MNRISMAARAVVCGAIAIGAATATGCGSDPPSSDAQKVGTIAIPLQTQVGASIYRLEAVFTITGESGPISLATDDDEPILSSTLPTGVYEVSIDSFTLSKDGGTGTFRPVAATVVASSLPFTITAQTTTTIAFHFVTDGMVVAPGEGNLDITFDVTETGCNPIVVDPDARTVQSAHFFLDFNGVEELAVLRWNGGENLTRAFAIDSCTVGLAHFGNSLVPPDVGHGGRVLVGEGSRGNWQRDGASVLIESVAADCPQSLGVAIETRYTFREGIGADTIEVVRHFDFDSEPLSSFFRPFVPRLTWDFDQVIHPNAAGTALIHEDVFACPYGCESADWDGSWFAYTASSGQFAGQGMIVHRAPSSIPARLWIDSDEGGTSTNSSSVLLVHDGAGFPQRVTETELLCFFDETSWTGSERAALTLPEGCTLDLECEATQPPVDDATRCTGAGLVHTIPDACMDDGGTTDGGDSLEVYCVAGRARFCLSNEPCPWRTALIDTPETCERSGLLPDYSTYLASAQCSLWRGESNYECDATGQIFFPATTSGPY